MMQPEHNPNEAAKSPRKKKTSVVYIALILFFAAVFVLSAAYLINYFIESAQQQADYRNLAEIVASIQAENNTATQSTRPQDNVPTPTDSDPDFTGTQPTEPVVLEILPEYKDLHAMNSDMVGWIKIADTKINYPVLQTDVNNKDYYIDHDFYGRSRGCGAIYVRETCDVFAPSDNLTIYGHHMKDMSMFAGLDYYKNKSFWEEHQTFSFDTLYEHHTYQVIAVFKTTANVGSGFSYHRFENAANEAEFDAFIDAVMDLSMYDTGFTAEYGDKLICLSTCEYTLNNGRFVVVAKRLT